MYSNDDLVVNIDHCSTHTIFLIEEIAALPALMDIDHPVRPPVAPGPGDKHGQ